LHRPAVRGGQHKNATGNRYPVKIRFAARIAGAVFVAIITGEYVMLSVPKNLLLLLVRVYQLCISPLLGPKCRFYPSCSNYALEAIRQFGAVKGSWLAIKRLCKCHPWHLGGYDPVPEKVKPTSSTACGCNHS
jgi:uncharacterized protein